MKITLVCYKYGVPLSDPCCYPLGFMYVSSILKQQGNKVKVLNYNLYNYNFVKEVQDQDLVMFTGFEEFKSSIIRDSLICKDIGIKTILGGALATFDGSEMSRYVDKIYKGEFDSKTKIDDIPYPDYEGFGVVEYHKANGIKHMGVLTTRGCPYHCTFCSQTCVFRMRSIDSVLKEIDYYKFTFDVQLIIFNDNTFNISKERFISICDGMKRRNIPWGASIRCDLFDDDMAKAASESNCQYFVIGIESFNQTKLNRMEKFLLVEDIYKTINLLDKYDIPYHGNILLGFENESYQDIVNEVNSIPKGSNVFPVLVQPFIGTSNGRYRKINDKEVAYLTEVFSEYVYARGKYQYPELPKEVIQ